jgi:DNA-binding IclR family transcriptional regulator
MSTQRDETSGAADPLGGGTTSVGKALSLLVVIAELDGSATLAALARAIGVPKSTAHRLLKELEDAGFVGRVGTRYQAGNRVFALAQTARWTTHGLLQECAQAPLSALLERGGSAVHLAVLDGAEVHYLDKLTGVGGGRLPTHAGARLPATCTALGKALLAFADPPVVRGTRLTRYSIADPRRLVEELRLVRRTGLAQECEEGRLGAACVAAPVLVDGVPVAAVSVSRPSGERPSPSQARMVQATASAIADALGRTGWMDRRQAG